tara:strand:+ start:149375 stop:150022 length:648 start_codon:yes stop_codon:yes gene_type:complete
LPKTIKKIIICEDHQIVIDGLRSIFKSNKRYDVVDYVRNATDLIKSLKKYSPDILILDLNLPGKNGLEILKDLKSNQEGLKIIILTMYNTESIIREVIKGKANGFLLKNCSTDDLMEALNHIYKSESFYLGEGVKKISNHSNLEKEDNFYNKIKITNREKEIIFELMQGLKVPQIAEKLIISTFTVETHKKNIFRKLGVKSSIDLLKFANENQLF